MFCHLLLTLLTEINANFTLCILSREIKLFTVFTFVQSICIVALK